MVPEGWSQQPLAEICRKQISYGIVQTGPDLPNGIPCLRVIDLTKSKNDPSEMIKTTQEIHDAYKKTILEEGEIVMALRGEVGLVKSIDKELIGANITRGLARLSPKTSKVLPEFLLWELRSPKFRSDLLRRVGGSALQEISLTELRKVNTLLPPKSEQKKIAKILSTWDKAIATVEKLITNSQQQKKALMQQLLTGKKRLPGFDGEWKEYSISKMGKVVSGGTPDTTNTAFWGGDVLWVTPTDVTSMPGKYMSSTARRITDAGVKASSATLVPPGSLLVCTRATIGYMAITTENTTTNQGFKNIVPFNSFNIEFVYYLLSYMKKELIRHASGSTFLEISKKDFEKLKYLCPKFNEQQKIAQVLTAADSEIENLQNQLEQLKQEKKSLMQQLLTGKRRVTIDSKELS